MATEATRSKCALNAFERVRLGEGMGKPQLEKIRAHSGRESQVKGTERDWEKRERENKLKMAFTLWWCQW